MDIPVITSKRQAARKLTLAQKEAIAGYAFIAPQVLGFMIFVAGPIIAIFLFSFQDRNLLNGIAEFTGFDNYRYMFNQDPYFFQVLKKSLIFMAGLVPTNIIMALALATLLNRKLHGMTFFRTLFFSPVVTSIAAWVIVWKFMLQDNAGTVNQFLQLIGIDGPNWLNQAPYAMIMAVLTLVLKNVGLNTVILIAAMKDLPAEQLEAAQVDGATPFQVYLRIVLPLISPSIMLATILTVIGSLSVFDHIMLLTAGGPQNSTMVLSYYMYFQAFKMYEVGYASTLAVTLFIVTMALTVAQWSLRRKLVYLEK
jgi:multiple sugar transport system permease protein